MQYITCQISTPLGILFALSDEHHLLLLEFLESTKRQKKIENITRDILQTKEDSPLFIQLRTELDEYFLGKRKEFSIPTKFAFGTEFQKKSWEALKTIPYGETRTYKEEAQMIGKPRAIRAVGGANHHNPLVIIVPCHRVIGKNQKLTGYGGGIARKQYLLDLEGNN